jgi:LAO/AO transport system kinase
LLVSNSKPESVATLSDEIDHHQRWLLSTGAQQKVLLDRARYRLRRIIERQLQTAITALDETDLKQSLPEQFKEVLRRLNAS